MELLCCLCATLQVEQWAKQCDDLLLSFFIWWTWIIRLHLFLVIWGKELDKQKQIYNVRLLLYVHCCEMLPCWQFITKLRTSCSEHKNNYLCSWLWTSLLLQHIDFRTHTSRKTQTHSLYLSANHRYFTSHKSLSRGAEMTTKLTAYWHTGNR